jgi:hypothetical protein
MKVSICALRWGRSYGKEEKKQDAESGNEILTYMQKVGKNDFYQRIPKSDPSKKLPNQKEKSTRTSNKKLRNRNQVITNPGKMTKGVKKRQKRPKKSINRS